MSASTAHCQYFLAKFSLYFTLTFSSATLFHLGQVVRLHQLHCKLIFHVHKQIFFTFLEKSCPQAWLPQLTNLSQLIQNPFHSLSESLNLAFSCINSIANSTRFSFFFLVLYTLSSLPSNFLISFLHLRSYSKNFLFKYALAFLWALSKSLWYSISAFFLYSIFFLFNLICSVFSKSDFFFSRFLVIVSLFFIKKNLRSKITEIVILYREYSLEIVLV